MEWFFPEHGQTSARGKAVCAGCPCRAECLSEALSYPQSDDHGVRGGLTQTERDNLRALNTRRVPEECVECGGLLPVVSGRGRRAERCDPCRKANRNRQIAANERKRYTERLFSQLRRQVAS